MKGTLGAPETDINKVVLTTLAARSVLGGTAGKALQTPGNILEGVGNILGGQKPVTGTNATNRATTTNAVPPVVEDILNIFKKKK